ncbi:MAG TPA: glycosyltransferase [Thermoanaerobaculia bacterium]|nr:glycosyltransferase [Thermoanaerobaculia bacterium]
MSTFDIIIPAHNEARTVAFVVRAAKESNAARVIVVDDHSTDDTAALAAEAGAEVIPSSGEKSKALALATGVAATNSEVLVFFDADILGARGQHFDVLAAPVLDGGFAMSCGMIDYGPATAIYTRFPPITGLRAVRRDVFEAIPQEKLNGFQVEIMINEVVARGRMRTAMRVLRGLGHLSKIDKLGRIHGTRAHVAMTLELLHCFTFVPLWTYASYLQNLTVLETL